MEEDGQLVERDAVTTGDELPAGAAVIMTGKVTLDTYSVMVQPDADTDASAGQE